MPLELSRGEPQRFHCRRFSQIAFRSIHYSQFMSQRWIADTVYEALQDFVKTCSDGLIREPLGAHALQRIQKLHSVLFFLLGTRHETLSDVNTVSTRPKSAGQEGEHFVGFISFRFRFVNYIVSRFSL